MAWMDDAIDQLMLQMQLQQLMGGGDNSQFMQRPPLAGDVPPATPPEAWFGNPPWLQGETPEGQGRPYPGPSGLSGGYAGRGKFGDLFGPNSPLRGTYRHTVPF